VIGPRQQRKVFHVRADPRYWSFAAREHSASTSSKQ